MLQAIRYSLGSLEIINQLLLPFETVYEEIKSVQEGHAAIQTMKVRGAPAIAIVAALSLAVELHIETSHRSHSPFTHPSHVSAFIHDKLEFLKTSRPTAVNLFEAADRLDALIRSVSLTTPDPSVVVQTYLDAAEAMLAKDVQDNQAIGQFGSDWILNRTGLSQVCLLTHCNTGSLATAGWGTALGIMRTLHVNNALSSAYCTETRPYNQGARLTAFELVHEGMNATLICDSMVSALLKTGTVSAIVVGADRVAANGDTANKIGTYQMAISAKFHNIPFIVAAPVTSIDLETPSGNEIRIEERPGVEVVNVRGLDVDDEAGVKNAVTATKTTSTVRVAADGIKVWNPSFDVTPASLITAIVTERGVIEKHPSKDVFDVAAFLVM